MTSADSCDFEGAPEFSWSVEKAGHPPDAGATGRACHPDREKAHILARTSDAISVPAIGEIDARENDLHSGFLPAKRFAQADGRNFWKR